MFALNVEKHPIVLNFLIYHQKEEGYMETNKFVSNSQRGLEASYSAV